MAASPQFGPFGWRHRCGPGCSSLRAFSGTHPTRQPRGERTLWLLVGLRYATAISLRSIARIGPLRSGGASPAASVPKNSPRLTPSLRCRRVWSRTPCQEPVSCHILPGTAPQDNSSPSPGRKSRLRRSKCDRVSAFDDVAGAYFISMPTSRGLRTTSFGSMCAMWSFAAVPSP